MNQGFNLLVLLCNCLNNLRFGLLTNELKKLLLLQSEKLYILIFFMLLPVFLIINKTIFSMASEIPTCMLNSENSFIPSLKFLLRALVICGLSYITKIFTNEIIFHKMGVFSNMNCKNSLISLHIVCCVNKAAFIKELFLE
jgi:hypothetical protein